VNAGGSGWRLSPADMDAIERYLQHHPLTTA
jgi:hypothetical protein